MVYMYLLNLILFFNIPDRERMGTRVYIGRVPQNTREKDVERFFKGYGKLRDVLMKPGYTFVVS